MSFITQIVPNNVVNFGGSELNHFREMQLQVVDNGISTCSIYNNFRPKVASDVISGMVVALVGMDVRVNFCDNKSNHC